MKKATLLSIVLILILSITTVYAEEWICPNCGKTNTTNFCTSCGTKHDIWICPNCGTENEDAFCGNCGTAKPIDISFLYGTWKYSSDDNTYIAFREDNTLLMSSFNGGLFKGTYTATSNTITIFSDEAKSETIKYTYTNDQLYFNEKNKPYTKTDEPFLFSVAMDGLSMEDTIPDSTVLYFACTDVSQVQRFNIVAAYFPNRGNTIFIKRVVGLPGDIIELQDGYLYINGEKLEEPYINDMYRSGKLNTCGPFTVPERCFFVLGDHRNNSNDSRSVGPLEADKIIGIMTTSPDIDLWTGQITGIHWERSISIEKSVPRSESDWSLPIGATRTDQKEELHHYDSVLDHYEGVEVQRSRQVVDHNETYYTYTDNGNGTFTEIPQERPVYTTEYYTETVQQPVYKQVPRYQIKYYFTVNEWQYSRKASSSGDNLNPEWPQTNLAANERESQKHQTYKLIVSDGQNTYTYRVDESYWHTINLNDTIYLACRKNTNEWFISDENGNYLASATREEQIW